MALFAGLLKPLCLSVALVVGATGAAFGQASIFQQNQVMAGPTSGSGFAAPRLIVFGDLPRGTNGQLMLGVTGSPPQMASMSQDCTITNAGVITCTKTNNVAFAASATTDTTNANNIASGTLGSARLPSPFTSGTASGNTSQFVTTTGARTTGHALTWDVNGNAVDGGAATGTVTTFSSGNLSPLFTTSVSNPASTPSQTFALSNANDKTIYSNVSGGSAPPQFNNAATVGASKVLLQCQSASNSASIVFNSSVITSTYDSYELEINSALPVTNAVSLLLTVSDDNGSTYKSASYQWARQLFYSGSTSISGAVNASDSAVKLIDGIWDSNTGRPLSGVVRFMAPAAAASRLVTFSGRFWGINGNLSGTFSFEHMVNGTYGTALAGILNNIKLAASSSNISAGNFCLYAIRNS